MCRINNNSGHFISCICKSARNVSATSRVISCKNMVKNNRYVRRYEDDLLDVTQEKNNFGTSQFIRAWGNKMLAKGFDKSWPLILVFGCLFIRLHPAYAAILALPLFYPLQSC